VQQFSQAGGAVSAGDLEADDLLQAGPALHDPQVLAPRVRRDRQRSSVFKCPAKLKAILRLEAEVSPQVALGVEVDDEGANAGSGGQSGEVRADGCLAAAALVVGDGDDAFKAKVRGGRGGHEGPPELGDLTVRSAYRIHRENTRDLPS